MKKAIRDHDALVLAELAAVLRDIARERSGARRLLKSMATTYETRAGRREPQIQV